MEFSAVNTIWVLVGAALVFFMQAGFAMVETGFTRAKNAGNIIMKNLMDFAIGTPLNWLTGFGIMFAGSGALSFEAISRGAKKAVCLDKDKRSIDIIKKNANSLDFSDYCEIINTSCFDYMERAKEKFDVIFLDPPYNKNFIEPVLEGIVKNNLLNEDGIVVLESDGTDFHDDFDGLEMYRQRKYGRTYITVYKKNN